MRGKTPFYLLKERSQSHSLHPCCSNKSRRPKKKPIKRLLSLNCITENFGLDWLMHAVDIYYYLVRKPSTSDWIFVGLSYSFMDTRHRHLASATVRVGTRAWKRNAIMEVDDEEVSLVEDVDLTNWDMMLSVIGSEILLSTPLCISLFVYLELLCLEFAAIKLSE